MTGVQTCALPIYFGLQLRLQASHQNRGVAKIKDLQGPSPNMPLRLISVPSRDTLLLFRYKNLVGEDSKLLVKAMHDMFNCLLFLHYLLQCCCKCFAGLFLCKCIILLQDFKLVIRNSAQFQGLINKGLHRVHQQCLFPSARINFLLELIAMLHLKHLMHRRQCLDFCFDYIQLCLSLLNGFLYIFYL